MIERSMPITARRGRSTARLRLAALASVAALALLAATPAAAGAAPVAKAKAVGRYVALAGSGSHLLFAAKKTSKTFTEDDARLHARQYVLDAEGERTRVPAGYQAFLVGDDPLFRRVTRSADGSSAVHWIRPEHGTHGVSSIPAGSTLVAAAPNGWVIETQVGGGSDRAVYRLDRVSTNGTVVDLGVPRPDGAPFTPETTPKGLLIVSDTSDGGDTASAGTLQYMAWSKPGSYRRIYPSAGTAPALSTAFDCGNSSSTLVRCRIGADEPTSTKLLALDGSKTWTSEWNCTWLYPAVRTTGIAWTDRTTGHGCTAGRVQQRSLNGKLTVSTRRYFRLQEPVTAFGKLVVATSTQRHLVTISTPRSKPKQIVGG